MRSPRVTDVQLGSFLYTTLKQTVKRMFTDHIPPTIVTVMRRSRRDLTEWNNDTISHQYPLSEISYIAEKHHEYICKYYIICKYLHYFKHRKGFSKAMLSNTKNVCLSHARSSIYVMIQVTLAHEVVTTISTQRWCLFSISIVLSQEK